MKYIVIIGCGKTGRNLALEFATSHNVVVIDRNKTALDSLGEDFNGKKVLGDALDTQVLENAGIKEADALVIVTGNDNLNIVIGKVAKKMYKVKKVALQVYELAKKKIFSEEGLIIVNRTYLLVEVFKKCIL
ncbi:MAG: TrkA family potassium uptake protein [Candidatus Omnitrophota bacterium]|nr:MAG: TrkA family potassium uptake protein [Candidatus Omnitrophota bacterium]RKY45919.1 MAG: TrkA family potassium uptake protein [Candidatus Omnitrophota bacterium]HDN85943.1 TrkA family potassium uptake protein [Candidatus Omnitrophota bacterium]